MGICQSKEDRFFHAVVVGDYNTVKKLLEYVDPSLYDQTALVHACLQNYIDIVLLLLADQRVIPNIDNDRPLYCACANGNVVLVRRLLEDPRVNRNAHKNLHKYYIPEIRELLEQPGHEDPN